MAVTKQQISDQLRSAGLRVGNVALCEGYVNVKVDPAGAPPDAVREKVRVEVRRIDPGVKQVNVELGPVAAAEGEPAQQPAQPQRPSGAPGKAAATAPGAPQSPQHNARADNPLPHVRHVVAVGAGKGGVGKSTVAVNLAVGLARRGLRVGLLDGDIYGPSTPTLLGLADEQLRGTQQSLFPFEVHGIKTMTIGKMVEPTKPLIWRGPMAHGAFRQLALQTDWGELDYLIVDLPPGTGDVPLTMSQMLPLSGAVIVCTPQKVAQDDAVRAAGMFGQLDVEVLGVVENMSYFVGDDGREYDIFGRGGAAQMARTLGVPVLAEVPIHMDLRANSDAGDPTANFTGNEQLAAQLDTLAANLIREVESRAAGAAPPTLTVS